MRFADAIARSQLFSPTIYDGLARMAVAEAYTGDNPGALSLGSGSAHAKVRYAGIWMRITAFQVDCFAVAAVCYVLQHLTSYFFARSHINWDFFELCLMFLYFTAFEISPMQATPGKWGSFFVTATDGSRLPWWRVLLRNLLRFVYLPPVYALAVSDGVRTTYTTVSIFCLITGVILCLCDPYRRMWHDLLTGSVHRCRPAKTDNPQVAPAGDMQDISRRRAMAVLESIRCNPDYPEARVQEIIDKAKRMGKESED